MTKLKISDEIVDAVLEKAFLKIYPVGSVYITIEPGNPSSKFGGTWVRLKNGYLYGVEADNRTRGELLDFTNNGTYTSSHTLTIDQMPEHKHYSTYWSDSTTPVCMSYNVGTNKGYNLSWELVNMVSTESNMKTSNVGGNKGHFHKIPCLCVIVWRRTA